MILIARYLLVLIGLGAASAWADTTTPAEALTETLSATRTLAGDFEQTVIGEGGEVIDQSAGTFVLSRPGRFYWHTTEPFPQKLISNGETIWLYDPDLLQVTVRPMSERQQNTPAMILSDSPDTLTEHYSVEREAMDAGRAYRLTPKTGDGLFESLTLAFTDGRLRRIELLDSLGQRTIFELTVRERNHTVADERFEFTVPEGVDLLTQSR